MNEYWSLSLLCRSDRLSDSIAALVDGLTDLGFGGVDTNGVWCMSADGSGSLVFETVDAAASWLADGEGLVGLHSEGMELDVSVHRHDGILATEMKQLPDQAIFDVVRLTVSAGKLAGPGWTQVQNAVAVSLRSVPYVFAYALSEATIEAIQEFACVHLRVAAGRLPPFIPWLMAVPHSSQLLPWMNEIARLLGRTSQDWGDSTVLTLSDAPWPDTTAVVLNASARWRSVSRDVGCPDA